MKKSLAILVILILLIGRAVWIEKNSPDQWSIAWKNYQDTESELQFVKEVVAVFRGEKLKRVPMSVREMNRIVYKWVDDRGESHMSYQKPVGVKNVQEIRLGDLNYQVEESLTDEEKRRVLGTDQ